MRNLIQRRIKYQLNKVFTPFIRIFALITQIQDFIQIVFRFKKLLLQQYSFFIYLYDFNVHFFLFHAKVKQVQIDIKGMVIQPTKQVPGLNVELEQQILEDLSKLHPRYKKGVTFFGGHPLSVTKKDENQIFQELNPYYQSPFLVCEKTDGVRFLCVVTNQCQYLISREGSKKLVSYKSECQIAKSWYKNPQSSFKNIIHILDGQMISDKTPKGNLKLKYLIFDALVIFGKNIIEKKLKQRLDLCEKFIRCNQFLLGQLSEEDYPSSAIEVKLKDFFRLTCNTYASSEVMRRRNLQSQPTTVQFLQKYYINALPHENDGIIFNREDKVYKIGPNAGYLKWKPAAYNTVDFLVIPNTKVDSKFSKRVLDLYLGWRDDSEGVEIYRMMFYNFTIVTMKIFQELQDEFTKKYNKLYDENPNLVTDDNFGVIAECITQKVEIGSEQSKIFRQLLSSMKKPEQIHSQIMRTTNEQKEIEVIKKIQGQPYSKMWQIFRIRKDKSLPNNYDVVLKIEQSIRDDIKYDDLVQKNKQLNSKTKIR